MGQQPSSDSRVAENPITKNQNKHNGVLEGMRNEQRGECGSLTDQEEHVHYVTARHNAKESDLLRPLVARGKTKMTEESRKDFRVKSVNGDSCENIQRKNKESCCEWKQPFLNRKENCLYSNNCGNSLLHEATGDRGMEYCVKSTSESMAMRKRQDKYDNSPSVLSEGVNTVEDLLRLKATDFNKLSDAPRPALTHLSDGLARDTAISATLSLGDSDSSPMERFPYEPTSPSGVWCSRSICSDAEPSLKVWLAKDGSGKVTETETDDSTTESRQTDDHQIKRGSTVKMIDSDLHQEPVMLKSPVSTLMSLALDAVATTFLYTGSRLKLPERISRQLENALEDLTPESKVDEQSVLHLACRYDLSNAIRSVIDYMNFQQRLECLFAPDRMGCTLLHTAAQWCSFGIVTYLMECLPSADVLRLISLDDEDGVNQNPLHSAVCNQRDADVILLLLQFLLTASKDCYTKKLLLSRDFFWSHTFLHEAALRGSVRIMKNILITLPERLTVQLLTERDEENKTALHLAALNERADDKVLLILMAFINSDYQKYKPVHGLLLICDDNRSTFLHLAAQHRSSSVMRELLMNLSPPMVLQLLKSRDLALQTPLHRAALNDCDGYTATTLIKFIYESFENQEVDELLFSVDTWKRTFFHWAAKCGSPDHIRNLLNALPIQTAVRLSLLRDQNGKTVRDLSEKDMVRDYLDQAGSFPVEFYFLESQPQVLIFYNTVNRQPFESEDGHVADAEEERRCVEEFCRDRNIPCKATKDPTVHDIFCGIKSAQKETAVSGLMVFIMGHGREGIVQVRRDDKSGIEHASIKHILTSMTCEELKGKPKVLVVQACQERLSSALSSAVCSNGHNTDGLAIEDSCRPTTHGTTAADITDTSAKYLDASKAGNHIDVCTDVPSDHPVKRSEISVDPIPAAIAGNADEAVKLYGSNFLLFMATIPGGLAVRNVMIPCLVESLRRLGPSECITQAVIHSQHQIRKTCPEQRPEFRSTLDKKFCIGKDFTD